MEYKYNLVVCGGTFDLLHEGHKSFLRFILSISKHVVLGLTSDIYINTKKKGQEIALYEVRYAALMSFFAAEQAAQRVQIFPIDAVYGPAIDQSFLFDGIVVTVDTIRGADMINKKRKQIGLQELPIIIAPLKKNIKNQIISSTAIRQGKITQKGDLYILPEWKKQYRKLPATMRSQLAKPLGEILQESINDAQELLGNIVTVGDVTTQLFLAKGIAPKIAIVDFVVERKETKETLKTLGFTGEEEVLHATNLAGTVSISLWDAIEKSISLQKPVIIVVHGEEDLAVIPLVLTLPLNFVVYYGQPNEGLVRVKITPDAKLTVWNIFNKFQP